MPYFKALCKAYYKHITCVTFVQLVVFECNNSTPNLDVL